MVSILWNHFITHLNSLNFVFQESVICKGSRESNHLQPMCPISTTTDFLEVALAVSIEITHILVVK